MEWKEILNQYSGLLSLIAIIVSVVAIWVALRIAKQSSKQIDDIHKDWDEKRKFSRDYDAYAEFQNNINKRR